MRLRTMGQNMNAVTEENYDEALRVARKDFDLRAVAVVFRTARTCRWREILPMSVKDYGSAGLMLLV